MGFKGKAPSLTGASPDPMVALSTRQGGARVATPKELGFLHATALVIGNMVGAGIFLLPSTVAVYGSIGLVGWGVTTVGALCLSMVFAKLSERYPKTGGPYVYSRKAFGDFVGFQVAWSYWVSIWVSNSAVVIALVGFLTALFPGLGAHPLYALATALSFIWGLTFLNMRSMRTVGDVQILTTFLKILPLLIMCAVGFFHVKLAHFSPLLTPGTGIFQGLSGAAAVTLFTFMGLESATIPAENIKAASKTIPRATMLGTFITALLYIGSSAAVMGILSIPTTAADPAAFASASGVALGPWALTAVAVCGAIASFGGLNGWILLLGQIPLAAARDHLFPEIFARVSKRGLPVVGLFISSSLVSILLFLNYEAGLTEQLRFLVTLTTFAVLLPYFYSSAAELFFLLRDYHRGTAPLVVKHVMVTCLALLYSFGTIAGAGEEIVFFGSFLVMGGIPVYVWMKSRKLPFHAARDEEA